MSTASNEVGLELVEGSEARSDERAKIVAYLTGRLPDTIETRDALAAVFSGAHRITSI